MEWCLGVTHHAEHSALSVPETAQADARDADTLMDAEGDDPARLRYPQDVGSPSRTRPLPPPRTRQER